ncbi:aminotransferase class III-fold pyridoxal phosphate-dependent enzyme [Arenibaculum sp.]|uniref:aminotransferase class III-fold pyridoxal phosphate-dependent enzyme n=1 Tax=Arenibaculum sp. TaxID=2865862 RepID=UPI002E12175C|nr:aminotransferase class III-fold pyridoxal phosphate-dependent enzyme [Arenibaculum sp.]
MTPLRHLGRPPLRLDGGADGRWRLEGGGTLLNASGGPLVQTLAQPPQPPDDLYDVVTPSGGVETPVRARLERELLARAGIEAGGVLWASSGSDAMEIALWFADWHAHARHGRAAATYLVRRGGYHGNSFLTRFLSTRGGTEPERTLDGRRLVILDEHADGASLPAAYVPADPGPDPDGGGGRLLAALARAEAQGAIVPPAVLVVEGVPTTGHVLWPGAGDLARTVAWCRERGILVVLDEIASGCFRHGGLTALGPGAGAGARPDVVTLSKGLTSGAYPLSCALLAPEHAEALRSANQRPLTFTYGLTDAAAWFTLDCLSRYDALAGSGAFSRRAAAIRSLLEGRRSNASTAGVAATATTIRVDLPAALAEPAIAALRGRGLWAYLGSTAFPLREGAAARAFLHLCPPLDLEPAEAEAALAAGLGAVDAVLAEA